MDSLSGSESIIWGNIDLKHCPTLQRPLLYNSHSLCPFDWKGLQHNHHWTPMSSFFCLLRTKLYWFTSWSKIKRISFWLKRLYVFIYLFLGCVCVKWFCLLMIVKTTKWFTGQIEINFSKINLTKQENSKSVFFLWVLSTWEMLICLTFSEWRAMFSLVPNNTHYRALLFTGADVVVGEAKIQKFFFFWLPIHIGKE